jgi:TolB-like protein/DNA-binding winged helix-turn-helix (wHTH) protein/tetratricopeptide (TPR) repeat protein
MNALPREYRFEGFVLQLSTRRLLDLEGQPVELSPRLFDALLFMVEHAGELLDKDRLLATWWPGLVVEENGLNQVVAGLRKALGDEAQSPRFIQTVPRRGFRFIAAVAAAEGPGPQAPFGLGAVLNPVSDAVPDVSPGSGREAGAMQPPRRRVVLAAGAGGLAVLAGLGAWAWRSRQAAPSPAAASTLAVLPFKPISLEGRDELLEVGMAESLVARLSNLPGVAVRSMGSVRRFAGPEQDPLDAARILQVTWIIDGSVQRAQGRVRVTARLLNTASGEAAWSGRFDETAASVFELQDAISARAAEVLVPHLQRSVRSRLAAPGGTRQVDAYQLYLIGRQQAQGVRFEGLVRSIESYRQAISLDPNYALAWSAMAESYRRMVFGADGEPAVVLAEAARCIDRAVALDPGLAEAHAGLGWVRLWRDWDWGGAERAFQRALELNPSEAIARLGFSQLLGILGRNAQALHQLGLARQSDPLSLILLTMESGLMYAVGRKAEGRTRLQRVFDLDPTFWVAHLTLGGMQAADGDGPAAVESMRRADQHADRSSQAAAALGHLLARQGQAAQALDLLQRLKAASAQRFVPPTSVGLIYAGLGDKEAAIAALQRGLAVRDVRMTLVRHDGRWALLRGD